MIVTEEQYKELTKLALPLQLWLEANCHPHCDIKIQSHSVELVEGICTNVRKPTDTVQGAITPGAEQENDIVKDTLDAIKRIKTAYPVLNDASLCDLVKHVMGIKYRTPVQP